MHLKKLHMTLPILENRDLLRVSGILFGLMPTLSPSLWSNCPLLRKNVEHINLAPLALHLSPHDENLVHILYHLFLYLPYPF